VFIVPGYRSVRTQDSGTKSQKLTESIPDEDPRTETTNEKAIDSAQKGKMDRRQVWELALR
jgi:hypothetical protein